METRITTSKDYKSKYGYEPGKSPNVDKLAIIINASENPERTARLILAFAEGLAKK